MTNEMSFPATFKCTKGGGRVRFYFRKAYKKARFKKVAARIPFECWY